MQKQQAPVARRRQARILTAQALYAWLLSHDDMSQILHDMLAEEDCSNADTAYFREALFGVTEHHAEIEAQLSLYVDRTVAELDPMEHAILLLSGFELIYRLDIPYRVVINEGLELAKQFGATDGHKFVNGVLDKLAQNARATEVQAKRNG